MGLFKDFAKGIGKYSGLGQLFGGSKTRLSEIQSEEEKQYLANLQSRQRKGTIDVDELNQVMGRTVGNQRQLQRTQQQGMMIQQGMANSIVAQELARKTDRETLASLADESRRISMLNEQSKIKAQDMLGEYGLMRSNRLMNIAQANAEYRRMESAEKQNRFMDVAKTIGTLAMSDARLKENIREIGVMHNIPIYEFEYKNKNYKEGRYRGVMAQDLLETYPDAVHKQDGYYYVDYNQLPVDMERVG